MLAQTGLPPELQHSDQMVQFHNHNSSPDVGWLKQQRQMFRYRGRRLLRVQCRNGILPKLAILAQLLLPRSMQSHSCLRTAVEWEGSVHVFSGDVTAKEMVPADAADIAVCEWAWVLDTIADA